LVVSKRPVPITKLHGVVKDVTKTQKEIPYCRKTKTVSCRTLQCFVIIAVQLVQIRSVYIAVSTGRI
jgi:ribosome-associated toxin RatA of RatAB toxin-antitoxin module